MHFALFPPTRSRALDLFSLVLALACASCDPEIHLGTLGGSLEEEAGAKDTGAIGGDDAAADRGPGDSLPDAKPGASADAGKTDANDAGGAAKDAVGLDREGAAGEAGGGGADAPGGAVLWSADFETGDLSQWIGDGKGGIQEESVPQDPTVVTSPAHEGTHSAAITISPPNMMISDDYIYRQDSTPIEAYYSAWFYVPQLYSIPNYLNIMHFVGSTTGGDQVLISIWDVDLQSRSDGQLIAYVWQFPLGDAGDGRRFDDGAAAPPVPIGKWVHFEVLFRKAADATGRFALWQDGALVIDVSGIETAPTDFLRWNIGAAAIDITPQPAVLYVDDAVISTTRLGP